MSSWTRWASCRRSWTPPTPGISTPSSSRPWTRCVAPPPDEPVTHLSGGEKRRVALCKLLLSKPDLLLLDEPTNHLDAESVLWLEQHLADYKGAILAVTHDRYFLDNVAEWILELDRGRAYRTRQLLHLPGEEGRALEVQGKKDQKLQRRLKEELAWVRSGAKARQAKSKARLGRYEEMAAEAEKTRKLDFEEIQIPAPPRLGNLVVEVSHLDKGFDGRVLIKDLSFTLPRNGIVGVIGPPNGVGKTTLFKTIVGLEQPDSGEVKVGETVKLSYVDQNRGGIDRRRTCGKWSPTAWTTSRSARTRSRRGPMCPHSVQGPPRSAEARGGCSPVVSATV